jgi:hypothetical protein
MEVSVHKLHERSAPEALWIWVGTFNGLSVVVVREVFPFQEPTTAVQLVPYVI